MTCWEVFAGGRTPYPGVNSMEVIEMLEQEDRMAQPNNVACGKEM